MKKTLTVLLSIFLLINTVNAEELDNNIPTSSNNESNIINEEVLKNIASEKQDETSNETLDNKDAREQALTLKPVFTKEETEKLLKETDDAYVLIGKFGTPSFGSPTNCANQLRRAQAGSGLTTLELLRIGENLRVIRSLRQWRNASDDRASSLDKYFNNLMPNKFLEEKINDAIIAEDEISDKLNVQHLIDELEQYRLKEVVYMLIAGYCGASFCSQRPVDSVEL